MGAEGKEEVAGLIDGQQEDCGDLGEVEPTSARSLTYWETSFFAMMRATRYVTVMN